MLDTARQVTTPELIELRLHPAGILPRALAWVIDLLIQLVMLVVASSILGWMMGAGIGLLLLVYFAIYWFYPVYFEVMRGGATPGKKALGLIVLNDDGTPVGWGASFTRNLLRTVDFLPFLYLTGMISILLHKEFRRLGDIVADTVVCYREPMSALPQIAAVPPLAPDAPLPRSAQRALLAFAERSRTLTPARQEELASLVPHLSEPTGPSPVRGAQRLLGLANFLIGRRA